MIHREGKEISAIHRNGHNVSEVWKYIDGAWRSVWQAIRSCFGRGFWSNLKPWSNTDSWRNM